MGGDVVTDPGQGMAARALPYCTVSQINDDTVTCYFEDHGSRLQ
jgi:hypothetical protein